MNFLLGRSQGSTIVASDYPEVLVPLTELPEQTLQRRPDLKAAFLAIEVDNYRTSVAYKDMLPSISLQAALSDTGQLVPARIILGNLIRNALQHCWEGTVVIEQQENRITITNPADQDLQGDAIESAANTGYGLGLTTTLRQRIGWHYTWSRHGKYHRVNLEV